MSNVLIGIIGIILFIGLALAGALYLGEQFSASSASSRAAAIASTLQQTAYAANMYELETGRTVVTRSDTRNGQFLVPEFLKQQPLNPHTGGPVTITDSEGRSSNGNRGVIMYATVGDRTDDFARDICRNIEKNAGAPNPEESMNSDNIRAAGNWSGWVGQNKRIGCLLNPGSNVYQAYIWF